MMLRGQWTATAESNTPGFHISSLYSPWVRWTDIVKEWYDVVAFPDKHQSFFNLRLGEPYEDKTSKIELGDLASHCHPYDAPVPTGVGVLTCGIDVQHDWIEVAVYGHGLDEQLWLIEEDQLHGDTSQQAVWDDLRTFLKSTYKAANGSALPINISFIDSGDQTELVYRHVKSMQDVDRTAIYPIKGFDGSRELFKWSKYKTTGKPRLGIVGVSQAKSILHQRLKNVTTPGAGYIHFPAGVSPTVLEQILSERRITVYSKGNVPSVIWKRIGTSRNEQLDCLVYAYAAFQALSLTIRTNLAGIIEKLALPASESPAEVAPPPRPRFAELRR
jgi:phage terminase large subunit GpA-like protein